MKTCSLVKTASVSLMLAGAMAIGSSAFAQESPKPPAHDMKAHGEAGAMKMSLDAKDTVFVKKAGGGNLAEAKLGELAQSKSENADVKSFGQMMTADHGKANENLKEVAAKKGMPFEPKLDSKSEALSEKLGKLSGEAFDKAYVAAMVKDHTEDVAEYKTATSSVKDADLKGYATTTLPIIEHHLEMAKEMHSKMNAVEKKK